jgi:hypothetical protein
MYDAETSEVVTILSFGTWGRDGERDPARYGNGELAEFVQFVDRDGDVHRYGITQDLAAQNGSRPGKFTEAKLKLRIGQKAVGRSTQAKMTVTAIEPVGAARPATVPAAGKS